MPFKRSKPVVDEPPDHDTEPVLDTPVEMVPIQIASVAETPGRLEITLAKPKPCCGHYSVNNRNIRVYSDGESGLMDALAAECLATFGPGKLSHVSGRRYRWR